MSYDEHAIHRLDKFLYNLAKRQPNLVELLPADERPSGEESLWEWVMHLPQPRMMQLCASWVLESLRRLRMSTPLSNVLLRGCIRLMGEFDLSDAAAIALGEVPDWSDPRREEIVAALSRAVRTGLLIYVAQGDRYCVPFPVRLSFEGVDFLGPLEDDRIRLRLIQNFHNLLANAEGPEELGSPRHWRFFNLLQAYETAVDLMEEWLGIEEQSWVSQPDLLDGVPPELVEPLLLFARVLGRTLTSRQSGGGARLLAASAAAARTAGDRQFEAELLGQVGQFHLRRRHFRPAIDAYRAAEKVSRQIDDPRGTIVAISACALAWRDSGNSEMAVKDFLRACAEAEERGVPEVALDTANCAGRLLLELDRPLESLRLLERFHEQISGLEGDFPAVAETMVLIGKSHRHLGVLAMARERLFFAADFARQSGHRLAEAEASLETALLLATAHEYSDSGRWLDRAQELYAELSDNVGVARCLMAQATNCRSQGLRTTADDHLRRALRHAQQTADAGLIAELWNERSHLELERGDLPKSIACLYEQTRSLRKTRLFERMVETHRRMANLYMRQEMMMAAGVEVLRAQAIARSYLRGEEPQGLRGTFERVIELLSPEQFEFLTEQVTQEFEEGKFGPLKS